MVVVRQYLDKKEERLKWVLAYTLAHCLMAFLSIAMPCAFSRLWGWFWPRPRLVRAESRLLRRRYIIKLDIET